MVRQRVPCTVQSVHVIVRFLRSCADIGGQFFLMGRRDCTLQDEARAEHRVAVKRCKLGTQPLPARHIADNGYNPAIDNRAEDGRFAESEPVWLRFLE